MVALAGLVLQDGTFYLTVSSSICHLLMRGEFFGQRPIAHLCYTREHRSYSILYSRYIPAIMHLPTALVFWIMGNLIRNPVLHGYLNLFKSCITKTRTEQSYTLTFPISVPQQNALACATVAPVHEENRSKMRHSTRQAAHTQ